MEVHFPVCGELFCCNEAGRIPTFFEYLFKILLISTVKHAGRYRFTHVLIVGINLSQHVAGKSGKEPIPKIRFVLEFSGSFHQVSGAAVKPIVFAVFAGDQLMDVWNAVIALFFTHGQRTFFNFVFGNLSQLGNLNEPVILFHRAVGADDNGLCFLQGQVGRHIGEIHAAVTDLAVEYNGKMLESHNPGKTVVFSGVDASPSWEVIIVAKNRLVKGNRLLGKPFVRIVLHINAKDTV